MCYRCGTSWVINKRKKRKDRPLCRSCKATKAISIQTGDFRCVPWHGLFAEDLATPLYEDGTEVLPGVRICGNKDCVQPTHIEETSSNGN